jgi:hypothetical protein
MAARHLQLEAANMRRQTNENFGFVAEHDMERKFREPRLPQVTPVPTKMVPASYGLSWHCRCCRRCTSGCSTRLRLGTVVQPAFAGNRKRPQGVSPSQEKRSLFRPQPQAGVTADTESSS